MASTPSSQSEGEIFSSASEKASVDRHPRPSASAPRSPAIRSPRSRSRSRSPYRVRRGEKRRREDDYGADRYRNDNRRFNVRREEDRHDIHHRRQDSYEDLDPGHTRRSYLRYDDDSDRRRHSKRPRTRSRSRSRSRSPYRHSRTSEPSGFSHHSGSNTPRRKRSQERDIRGSGQSNRPQNEQSVSAQSTASSAAQPSKSHAETGTNQMSQENTNASPNDRTETNENSVETFNDALAKEPPVLDEAAQIEERRKRREALKNKFRGQATPLRLQVLHLNVESNLAISGANPTQEDPGTPASPDPGSPQTPADMSGAQTPVDLSLSKKEDIANDEIDPNLDREDEPSAADYDPTFDMQEERSRHDKQLFNEASPSPRKESHLVSQAISQTQNEVESAPSKKSKDTFDMFADDDDDLDMFAEAPTKSIDMPKVEVKTAHALDVNMMDNWDDPEGYYNTMLGELIQGRYHVQENLGRGMFASVVRATDTKTSRKVAIKIVRNNESMYKSGKKEIDILKELAANDPEDRKHIVRLEGSFEHKGHLCMVFENLSINLRELLKQYGRNTGITLKAIRAYAQQLFLSLSLLKKCQFLHADLKPDNILVNDNLNVLKLCDLGTASPITEAATAPYLVSRFYRAPELILGIPYDYGIDIWSLGCTLFELYTGKILFTGRNNNGMLRSIMECRGKYPHKLLRKGSETYKYFDDLLNFNAIEEDKLTRRMVVKTIDIKAKPIRDLRSRIVPKGKKLDEAERKELELFLDLLDKCLDLRVEKRITPTEALKHPFILRTKT